MLSDNNTTEHTLFTPPDFVVYIYNYFKWFLENIKDYQLPEITERLTMPGRWFKYCKLIDENTSSMKYISYWVILQIQLGLPLILAVSQMAKQLCQKEAVNKFTIKLKSLSLMAFIVDPALHCHCLRWMSHFAMCSSSLAINDYI